MKTSTIIFWAESSTSLTALALSYHCFKHNNIYNFIIVVLKALNIPAQFSSIIPPLFLLLMFFVSALTGVFSKICHLSLILIIPSALYFSRLDWLQILNFPINLQLFATDLPLTHILCSGLLILSVETFLHFSSQSKKIRMELLKRGADKKDAEDAAMRQFKFISFVIIITAIIALATTSIAFLLKEVIQNFAKLIPYPYISLGVISATTLGASILVYLKAKATKG